MLICVKSNGKLLFFIISDYYLIVLNNSTPCHASKTALCPLHYLFCVNIFPPFFYIQETMSKSLSMQPHITNAIDREYTHIEKRWNIPSLTL